MATLVRLPRRGAAAQRGRRARVLVIGRPNSGKTTLFNRLAGTSLRTGNYPGVTVEGAWADRDLPGAGPVHLVDLPGTYSLVGRSDEERIAIDALLDEPPDAVLLVLDATRLQTQLYLALQVLELGVPCVVVLTMADAARDAGLDIDVAALADWLGVPAVAVCGVDGQGVDDLQARLGHVLRDPDAGRSRHALVPSPGLRDAAAAVIGAPPHVRPEPWALLQIVGAESGPVADARAAMERGGADPDGELASARYAAIDAHLGAIVRGGGPRPAHRLDRILVHPVWGTAVVLLLGVTLFQALFAGSDPLIGAIEAAFAFAGDAARGVLPAGLLADFVVDGVIAGVGSVLVFLPQVALLFFAIGALEDSGYLARIAFLMDRAMRAVGLPGRAFVPMLSGFACAVPAILATRTLERRRDRMLTMMVVPLMTCSARLPVYTLLIGALFPVTALGWLPLQGMLMLALYGLAVLSALVVASVLGRTVFRGQHEPLVLELPPYRWPRPITVLRMSWDRIRTFLVDAGTVILACSVVMWGLLSFPRVDPQTNDATAQLQQSYGGRLGHALEPAIAPLGFDWKIGVGLVGAFAAREVFVSTLGVVYGVGDDVDESSSTLRARIRAEQRADGRPVYTPRTGLSLLVFFALSAQCMSTLAAIKRETRSWRWPIFLFAWMTALAWLASLVVYQGAGLLGMP